MTEPNALALSGLRGDASAPQLLGKQRQGRIALRQGIRRSIRIEQECNRTHRGVEDASASSERKATVGCACEAHEPSGHSPSELRGANCCA